jgi:4-hydroxybutyrate dehydrogenase
MQQYHFPTTIYFGEDALQSLAETLRQKGHQRILFVTDKTLSSLGMTGRVIDALTDSGAEFFVFDDVHPNPLEEDVEAGSAVYIANACDSIVALGGGSAMDAGKVIKIAVSHPAPLAQYDATLGGDALLTNAMPPLYAVATTAGTGSEVGRAGVIVMRESQKKTIFFAPTIMPDIAVLCPPLTVGLPAHITAATGIDAFTHSLEAWLAPGFHPLADGLAIEGMRLCLENLGTCYQHGDNLEARGRMQLAATMGATAFQKGLGMIHSLAHPLSAQFNTHHGLANALLLPFAIQFIEQSDLTPQQRQRLEKVQGLFKEAGMAGASLCVSCRDWFINLGINFGLQFHDIPQDKLEFLAAEAYEDPCHGTNIIQVSREDLLSVYRQSW